MKLTNIDLLKIYYSNRDKIVNDEIKIEISSKKDIKKILNSFDDFNTYEKQAFKILKTYDNKIKESFFNFYIDWKKKVFYNIPLNKKLYVNEKLKVLKKKKTVQIKQSDNNDLFDNSLSFDVFFDKEKTEEILNYLERTKSNRKEILESSDFQLKIKGKIIDGKPQDEKRIKICHDFLEVFEKKDIEGINKHLTDLMYYMKYIKENGNGNNNEKYLSNKDRMFFEFISAGENFSYYVKDFLSLTNYKEAVESNKFHKRLETIKTLGYLYSNRSFHNLFEIFHVEKNHFKIVVVHNNKLSSYMKQTLKKENISFDELIKRELIYYFDVDKSREKSEVFVDDISFSSNYTIKRIFTDKKLLDELLYFNINIKNKETKDVIKNCCDFFNPCFVRERNIDGSYSTFLVFKEIIKEDFFVEKSKKVELSFKNTEEGICIISNASELLTPKQLDTINKNFVFFFIDKVASQYKFTKNFEENSRAIQELFLLNKVLFNINEFKSDKNKYTKLSDWIPKLDYRLKNTNETFLDIILKKLSYSIEKEIKIFLKNPKNNFAIPILKKVRKKMDKNAILLFYYFLIDNGNNEYNFLDMANDFFNDDDFFKNHFPNSYNVFSENLNVEKESYNKHPLTILSDYKQTKSFESYILSKKNYYEFEETLELVYSFYCTYEEFTVNSYIYSKYSIRHFIKEFSEMLNKIKKSGLLNNQKLLLLLQTFNNISVLPEPKELIEYLTFFYEVKRKNKSFTIEKLTKYLIVLFNEKVGYSFSYSNNVIRGKNTLNWYIDYIRNFEDNKEEFEQEKNNFDDIMNDNRGVFSKEDIYDRLKSFKKIKKTFSFFPENFQTKKEKLSIELEIFKNNDFSKKLERYNEIKYEQEKEQKFEEVINTEQYLNLTSFVDELDEFELIIPQNITEYKKEGQNLGHCLRTETYLSEVINKETFIIFVRRKINVEKSFVTLQISKNIMRQKGFLIKQEQGENYSSIDSETYLDFAKKYREFLSELEYS